MKRIFSAIISGVSLILFGAALSGCAEELVDINDEVTLGRCLTPTELSAKIIDGEFIEFSWTKSKGATEFVLELYSDEQMTSLVETLTIPAAEVPYTADLEADMTYYARVKGVNAEDLLDDSHWAVFDRALQTYAIKSSLNPELVDRTESSITIKWTKDAEVDHIRITPAVNADEEYTRFDVSSAAVEAAQVEVTGLNPSVNYTLAVHFKSADRGQVSAWTRPSIDGAVEVATSEALLQALTDGAAVIKVAYSETPYVIGSVKISKPVALYGDATAAGAQPVIQGGIKIADGVTSVHCEALTFDGLGLSDYPHHLTFDAAATVESISVVNCNLNNYLRGVLYENNMAPKVNHITYNGTVVNNVGGDGGDCFDFRGKATVGDITFTNCTLNGGARTWFRLDANATLESISLTHCTFNNLCFANNGNNNGIFNIRALNVSGAAPVFVLTHNVFLNMNDENKRCCLIAKNSTSAFPTELSNNFFFNCYDRFFIPQKDGSTLSGDDLKKAAEDGRARILVNGSVELQDDPCVDSVRDKYNVTSKEVIEANAGDPRWYAAYVEIPEDLTQEVTATGKVWDLTDGQTFKKAADKDMVRDGIRFYVKNTPVNFTKDGFEFSGEASLGEDGIPVDGAIGIKVNQPGSVVISVAEATGHSNLTVSLDGKVSASVAAGSELQKVTFANIEKESMIYIYGCHPATMTFLQWTSDIQVLDKVLATPVVSISKTTVNERAEDEITLSWDAVDYAGSYNVTIDGKVKNVTETTYTFSTANYAVEEEGGDFAIEVTAVPAEDDFLRLESEAALLSFHVNDVPVVDTGGIPSDPDAIETEYKVVFKEDAANFPSQTFTSSPTNVGNSKFVVKAKDDTKSKMDGGVIKFGGKSDVGEGNIPTARYMSFKITSPGTIYHMSAASGDSGERHFVIALAKEGSTEAVVLYDEIKTKDGDSEFQTVEVTEEHLEGATSALTVYMYCTGNAVNIKGAGFAPKAKSVDYVWDFSATEWVDAMGAVAKNTNDSNWNIEVNGLKMVSGGGSIKWNTMNFNGTELYYWQIGGGGSATKRYFEFTADVPGTVSVYASGTNDNMDQRNVLVQVGDAEAESQFGASKKSEGPAKLDFDVSKGAVKIYPDGGLIFYKIEFHSK